MPRTTPYTTHYIRFSTLPYTELYSALNVYSDDLVNAVFSKAVLDALNSSEINIMDTSFDRTQLIVDCSAVPRS